MDTQRHSEHGELNPQGTGEEERPTSFDEIMKSVYKKEKEQKTKTSPPPKDFSINHYSNQFLRHEMLLRIANIQYPNEYNA